MLCSSFGFIVVCDMIFFVSFIVGVVMDVKVQNGVEVKMGDVFVIYDICLFEVMFVKDQVLFVKDKLIYDNVKIMFDCVMSFGEKGVLMQQIIDNVIVVVQQVQVVMVFDIVQIQVDKVVFLNVQIVVFYDGKFGVILVFKGVYVVVGMVVGIIVDNKNVYVVFIFFEVDLCVVCEVFFKNELLVFICLINVSDGMQFVLVLVFFIDNVVDQIFGMFWFWVMIDNFFKVFWLGELVFVCVIVGIVYNLVLVFNVVIVLQQNGMVVYVVGEENKI